ncbi:MAG: helix-turn-helix domain-containing protein [Actinomycetota bacterium]
MALLERVTAESVTDLDQWRGHISQTFVPLSSDTLPSASSFRADLSVGEFGPVQVARVQATPQTVWRSAADIESGAVERVKVSLVVRGRTRLEQGDVDAIVAPGQIVAYHCDRRYRLSMPDTFEQIVLSIDRHLLPLQPGQARVLPDSGVFARCLFSLAASFHAGNDPCSPSTAEEAILGDRLVDFLGLALAPDQALPSTAPTDRQLYVRAIDFIRSNLGEPGLNPLVIAAATGVSERKLFALFRSNGESVMDLVTRERLDRARADLLAAENSGSTITAIAAARGFKSSSHFTRRFVQQFGMTPRECRSAGDSNAQTDR